MILIFTVTPHFFSRKTSSLSFTWLVVMILLTIHRNTSTTVSLFAGVQVLSIISVRSVSNTCSIGRIGGKKALKSKGLLALFGPVNPGDENRGPKNICKSRYLTILCGRRPTRENRELKSADCNHILTIFSIGRDRSSSADVGRRRRRHSNFNSIDSARRVRGVYMYT